MSSLRYEDPEGCLPGLPDLTLDTLHLELLPSQITLSLYLGAVLHESCRNFVPARDQKSA
jgi:hypothetical protein